MGYTHYWGVIDTTVWAQIWPELVSDANRIIEQSGVELAQDEFCRDRATVDGIKINGVDGCGHEPFVLESHGTGRRFCKTARKPYDLVVATILMRAKVLAGSTAFGFGSDGDWNDDWAPAKKFYVKLWPDDLLDKIFEDEDEE